MYLGSEMFRFGKYLLIISVFIMGWIAAAGYDSYLEYGKEQPYSESGVEIASPNDWIDKNNVEIDNNGIYINIENASLSQFTNTNSMDPLLDENANAIKIKPSQDLKIGDIISYKINDRIVIHRIVEINEDELGEYYIVKGDNNNYPDKTKVRFEQITGVLVGILY